jgi:hypothetical protein
MMIHLNDWTAAEQSRPCPTRNLFDPMRQFTRVKAKSNRRCQSPMEDSSKPLVFKVFGCEYIRAHAVNLLDACGVLFHLSELFGRMRKLRFTIAMTINIKAESIDLIAHVLHRSNLCLAMSDKARIPDTAFYLRI